MPRLTLLQERGLYNYQSSHRLSVWTLRHLGLKDAIMKFIKSMISYFIHTQYKLAKDNVIDKIYLECLP